MSRSKAAKRTTKNKPNFTRREQRDLSVSCERLGSIAVYREAINRLFVSSSEGFSAVGAAAKANRKIDGSTYSYSWDAEIRTITIKFKFKNR